MTSPAVPRPALGLETSVAVAGRSAGRVRVVDGARAYVPLESNEREPLGLYGCLKGLLRP